MKPDINSKEYTQAISVDEMRRSDKYTTDNFTSGKELMLRAAKGICNSCMWLNKKVAIICGSGNNGGDGYALSCLLTKYGYTAEIYRLWDKFSDDGRYYYDMAIEMGVKDYMFCPDTDLTSYDIIVDCIFGTGFKGTPIGVAADAINKINNTKAYVVCADINSGIDGDTGEASLAVRSDLTVSIGFYKKGMFLNNAPGLIGDLVNVDIGIILIKNGV